MLLIPCPWCGERHESEFTYGGDASPVAPVGEQEHKTSKWYAYVYERDNPAGLLHELWHHSFGCGRWIRLARDTRTNAFINDEESTP